MYKSKIGFVIGSGCSLRYVDPKLTEGHRVIAVNGAILKFPQADYWFSCDARSTLRKSWLTVRKSSCQIVVALGGSDFDCYDEVRGSYWAEGIEDRVTHIDRDRHRMIMDGKKLIGGTSSAHCAVHLANMLGCEPIVLLGMDCCFEGGKQRFTDFDTEPDDGFYKEEFKHCVKNDYPIVETFLTTWQQMAKANPDVEIINASGGDLEVFPRMTIEEVLEKYA